MALPIGHKKYGGRVKGVPNKRTLAFIEILSRENFCPATALIEIHREARAGYNNCIDSSVDLNSDRVSGAADKADRYLKIALDAAKDLASYSFPKLKAVEQEKKSLTDGMSVQEKIDAMKQYVSILEMEVKNST